MPKKSRHGKGKHPHYSKKSKAIQRQRAMALQPPTVEGPKQAVTVEAPPVAKVVAAPVKTGITQHLYVTEELKRIGILAGIILVILIVLSMVLS